MPFYIVGHTTSQCGNAFLPWCHLSTSLSEPWKQTHAMCVSLRMHDPAKTPQILWRCVSGIRPGRRWTGNGVRAPATVNARMIRTASAIRPASKTLPAVVPNSLPPRMPAIARRFKKSDPLQAVRFNIRPVELHDGDSEITLEW